MIGINFVYEKDGFLESLNLKLELPTNKVVESFDFNTNSFDDLIDYIEFMDFEEYVFVGLGEPQRIIEIVNYLQKLISIPIKFVNRSASTDYLTSRNLKDVDNQLQNHPDLDTFAAFLQGYQCFQTTLYPTNLRKGLIKHLNVDNLSLFLKENSNLIRHFGINSAIYSNSRESKVPLITLDPTEFNSKFSNIISSESKEFLIQNIESFIETGKVSETKIPMNYGILLGINKFHSFYFYNQKFYLDSEHTLEVGKSGDSYQMILNNASIINNSCNIPAGLEYLYPTLININRIYKDVKFTTVYNKSNLPANETSRFNWIGFETGEQKFVLNLKAQKIFEVNSLYLQIFEQIIKNHSSPSPETKQVLETLRLYN